jgi:hypothetical protein
MSPDDFEVRHHRHVLVFQIVAVDDVAALAAVKANDEPRDPAGAEIGRVLPPGGGSGVGVSAVLRLDSSTSRALCSRSASAAVESLGER